MNRRRGALVFTRSAFLFCVVPLLDPGNGISSGTAFRLSGDLANMVNDISYSTVSITITVTKLSQIRLDGPKCFRDLLKWTVNKGSCSRWLTKHCILKYTQV